MNWHGEDNVGHSMLTIHIDASTWGLGIWFLLEKRGYQCLLPIQHPTDAIFFFKALTVCSAIHISVCFPGATHLLIATDNTNVFDVFALPITQSSSQWSTFSSDVTLTWELFTFQDHSITSLMHYCDTKIISPGNSFLPFRLNNLHPLGMYWGL